MSNLATVICAGAAAAAKPWSGGVATGSPVVQVGHPVAEATCALQAERETDAGGEGARATPDDYGRNEEVAHIHQADLEGFGGQVGPTNGDVLSRSTGRSSWLKKV
jgi:hypothetical protein